MDEALACAKARFGPDLAEWVRLERADFGWIARVEEVAPDGRIGHGVLAIGPTCDRARLYPAGPSARVRRAHLAWLESVTRLAADVEGPPSFS